MIFCEVLSVSDPSVHPLLEVLLLGWVELTGATRHDVTVARDGVRHVKVVNDVSKQGSADLSVTAIS